MVTTIINIRFLKQAAQSVQCSPGNGAAGVSRDLGNGATFSLLIKISPAATQP